MTLPAQDQGRPARRKAAPRQYRGWIFLVVVIIVVLAGLGTLYALTCGDCPAGGSGVVSISFLSETRSASSARQTFYVNLSFTVTLPARGATCGCGWGGASPTPRYGAQNFGLTLWNASMETELPTVRAACAGGQNFSACVSAGSSPTWYAVLFDPGSAVLAGFPTASGAGQYNWTSDPGLPATGEQFSLVSKAPIPAGTVLQVYGVVPYSGAGSTGSTTL